MNAKMDDADDIVICANILLMLLDDELFDDGEESEKRVHEYWVRPWIGRRETSDTAFTLLRELQAEDDTKEFRRMVRMDERTYTELLEMLTPHIEKQTTQMRDPISAPVRLAVTMRFLAFGQNYPALSHDFRLGVTTIMLCIRETCLAIYNVLRGEYLKTPTTERGWREVVRGYNLKWNFPHCIGALDGKHIRVQKPRRSGSTYYNYKGYFSITMLALVDANYRFIYVDVGGEGKISDGGLWKVSKLRRAIEKDRLNVPEREILPGSEKETPYVIVGDDAFPLGEHMMKPFNRRNMTQPERVFNYRLSRARRCAENAFGILATRFRLFLRDIQAHPVNAKIFVLAGVCLHNFLREKCGKSYLHPGSVDAEDANNNLVPGEWRQVVHPGRNLPATRVRNCPAAAKVVRLDLAEYFQTPAGSVPWQDRAVDCGFVAPR